MTQKQKVILVNGDVAEVIKIMPEPLSGNMVYIIKGQYKGAKDEEHGYQRDYYGEGTGFVYPSEIREYIYE